MEPEIKDSARLTVDNLFKTKLCRYFSVKEDENGDTFLTMQFKKPRGTPSPNDKKYVPPRQQFIAYKKLNQSQNSRNRSRLENYYNNGRYSKPRDDRSSGNWRGHHLNPGASVFRPRNVNTTHHTVQRVDRGVDPLQIPEAVQVLQPAISPSHSNSEISHPVISHDLKPPDPPDSMSTISNCTADKPLNNLSLEHTSVDEQSCSSVAEHSSAQYIHGTPRYVQQFSNEEHSSAGSSDDDKTPDDEQSFDGEKFSDDELFSIISDDERYKKVVDILLLRNKLYSSYYSSLFGDKSITCKQMINGLSNDGADSTKLSVHEQSS